MRVSPCRRAWRQKVSYLVGWFVACGSGAALFLALYIDLLIEGIDPFAFPVESLGSLDMILHCLVIGLHQLKKPQFFSSVFRFVEPTGESIALFVIKAIERPIFFLHFLEYFS